MKDEMKKSCLGFYSSLIAAALIPSIKGIIENDG
jgi:hypothetical protein